MTYLVYLCQVVNLLYIVLVIVHRVCDREKSHVRRAHQRSLQLPWILQFFQPTHHFEPSPPGVDHTNSLLQALFKRPADGHDFTDTLHSATNFTVDLVAELGEIPFRNLCHDIVERRFEARSGRFCDCIRQLGKGVSQGDLGCRVGEWVSRCLGRQSGGTAQSGRIHEQLSIANTPTRTEH